jgi:membrane fusion protein (multidrug efflux system)
MFARPRMVFAVREARAGGARGGAGAAGHKQFVFKVVMVRRRRARWRKRLEARIGLRLPGKVEMLEGVAAGDWVVTGRAARLARATGCRCGSIDARQAGRRGPPAPGAASRPVAAIAGPPPRRPA